MHIGRTRSHYRNCLARLLIATALAYIWVVYLGIHALTSPWQRRIHRRARCDLSLFQLGLRLLAYCLKEGLPHPKGLLAHFTGSLDALNG